MSYLSYKITLFLGGGLCLLLHIAKNILIWKTNLTIQVFTKNCYRLASSVWQQPKDKIEELCDN